MLIYETVLKKNISYWPLIYFFRLEHIKKSTSEVKKISRIIRLGFTNARNV